MLLTLRDRQSWRTGGLAAALILILSSCGSTVQWSNETVERGLANEFDGDGHARAQAAKDGQGNEPGNHEFVVTDPKTSPEDDHASGGGRLAVVQNEGSSQNAKTTNQSSTARPRSIFPGVTDEEIYIGFATVDGVDGFRRQAGISGESGRMSDYGKAVVRDINRQGGIAGRQVVLVIQDTPVEQAINNPSQAAAVACAKWTNDRPVYAAIMVGGLSEHAAVATCLSRQGSLYIPAAGWEIPENVYNRFALYVYSPVGVRTERMARTWVKRLVRMGYFEGGWNINPAVPGPEPTKIGVLTNRLQLGPEFREIISRELGRFGLSVAVKHEISGRIERGTDEYMQAAARFRNEGVTHVIPYVTVGGAAMVFESQNYRPRWAVTSFNGPIGAQDNVASGQLVGAMGIGYLPTFDVDNERDVKRSMAGAKCEKIMNEAGQNTSARRALIYMFGTCDTFNFLAAALKRGDMSASGFGREVSSMGSTHPAVTFRASHPQGRPDGAEVARDLVWERSCDCFTYASGSNHAM